MPGSVFPMPGKRLYYVPLLAPGTEPTGRRMTPQQIRDSGERPTPRINSDPQRVGRIKWCRSCDRVLNPKTTSALCEQHRKDLAKLRRDTRRLPKTYRVSAQDLQRLHDLASDLAMGRTTLRDALRNRESIEEPLEEIIRSSGAIAAHVHRRIPVPRG